MPPFLIPLVFRAIPELQYVYPLGADTPLYMSAMKYGLSGSYEQTNAYYLMLRGLGLLGIDPSLFFKVFPPVMFALVGLVLAIYARRHLNWDAKSLVILSLMYSFAPALLQVSWTSHRELFSIFLLGAALVVETIEVRRMVKSLSLAMLYLLIAFSHEFVFAIAVAILVGRALLHLREIGFKEVFPPLVVAIPAIVAYSILRFDFIQPLVGRVLVNNYQGAVAFTSGWQRFDWWLSVGLLALGFMTLIAMLGFFRDDTLLPWLFVTIVPYLSFAISYLSFNQPERYLFVAAIPISFYATNFVRKLDIRKLSMYGILALLSVQPLSMIGVMPSPVSFYANKTYYVLTDSLHPSIPVEQIRALQTFSQTTSTLKNEPTSMIVPSDIPLSWWAGYYFPGSLLSLSGSAESTRALNGYVSLLFIGKSGSPPPSGRAASLLESYGGLDFYYIQ